MARLKLSPEVAWYLLDRGYQLPSCPPTIKTPEPSGRWVKFDPHRVDRVVGVFRRLRHTQGKWAGQPLEPDAWEVAYVLGPIFGWVRRDEDRVWRRVIRKAYLDIPRKNGKTTIAGGIAMYLTAGDGEGGAQVYAVATGKDQARFCFDPVAELAKSSGDLKPYVKVNKSRIVHLPSSSYFAVVSSIADLMIGANVHGAIVDELHLHKSPMLVEAVESGMGARAEPLVVTPTNADDGRQATIYDRRRHYIEQLAARVLRDDSQYGVVWCADEADDPFVEATWKKANPGYGTSPTKRFLREEARKARNSPADLAAFQRWHLGIRTSVEPRYIDLPVWDRNAGMTVDEKTLAGREAYGGLDLAATGDLNALCWDFPDDDGGHEAIWRFWLPERAYERLSKATAGMAEVWRREGWLTVTDGDVANYDFIRSQINTDREVFDVREVAYDPWNSSQLVNDLMGDGLELVKVRQGYASLSPPTKQLLHVLLEGTAKQPRYRHGGNPVMRWQVDNLRVSSDAAGNVKPDKEKSMEKIDGFHAAVMALDRAMNRPEKRVSAYETGRLEVL